ncbi:hypothetical protein CYLTODRAFT_485419 [Cylindrobasidium torrendii FP15055 ss-10]|uniref:Thioredoxin domain-containing protein n=1 Tax=Cylindrobasidium torrendii FP15055 ss-10 TaxID=1314674 RepID=A0A0D7BSP4_9AGAR|nr:hypothetical protein CYLTODRAFT_485419 [Cylindrobasidium torrendii FP15055 ss-10]
MPLIVSEASAVPDDATVIFYSSIVDGKLWCPDCRDVEGIVNATFQGEKKPTAYLVYVGDRPTWKSPKSVFRAEPWKITSVPTILKRKDGKEVSRIQDSEILSKLPEFVEE